MMLSFSLKNNTVGCFLILIVLNIARCVHAQDDTSPPDISNISPEADSVLEDSNVVFSANVIDASGIRSVKFTLRDPSSGQTQQYDGSLRDGTTDTYETEPIPFATGGAWRYRIKAVDDSPSRNSITHPWTEFLVLIDPASAIAVAKQEIEALIDTTSDVNLAPKFIRLGFHDCVPDASFQGGCDGCVDLSHGDNFGLDIPIDALRPIVDKYASPAFGISRADIWALAALVGSEVSQNDISFPMEYIGRVDCENAHEVCYKEDGTTEQPCQENRGPHRPLPEPDLTTSQLLHWFSQRFEYSTRETTAIMGAHTVGVAARENSGFEGEAGWVNNPTRLSNDYYNMICSPPGRPDAINDFESAMFAPSWDLEFIDNSGDGFGTPDRFQWFHQKDPDRDDADVINLEKLLMLNADIALVRDLEGHLQPDGNVPTCQFRCLNNECRNGALPRCPHAAQTFDIVVEFEADNILWLNEFSAAFRKMLIRGYSPADESCTDFPCTLIPGEYEDHSSDDDIAEDDTGEDDTGEDDSSTGSDEDDCNLFNLLANKMTKSSNIFD